MAGPSSATPSSRSRIVAPVQTRVLWSITDPGIRQVVKNVREKIHHEIRGGNNQNASLDQRVVPGLDGLDGKAPDPRPGEDGLRDDGAGKESAELKPYNRDDREKGIAEGVFQPDPPLAQSFGPGSLDVILVNGLQKARADHPDKDGGHQHAQGERGENKMSQPFSPRDRQPAQLYGEDDHQQGAEPKIGHRKAQQGKKQSNPIPQTIFFHFRQYPQREGDEEGDPHGGQG